MSETKNTNPNQAKDEIKNAIAVMEKHGMIMPKNISDSVMNSLKAYEAQGAINIPPNYSAPNALKSAWLKFQASPDLMKCEPASIANALLDMTIAGLNPSKNQCYFIPMGGKCVLMTSYFGKQCAVKRIKGVKDIRADVIYNGTGYELNLDEWGNDDITITSPCPLEERASNNIIAAWARIILDEKVWGTDTFTVIMTMEEIKNAFNMGNAKGKSPAHQNFLGEMAKRSAINRCIKNFLNTRDDEDILIEVINRAAEADYMERSNPKESAYNEINSKQASEVIDIEVEPVETPLNAKQSRPAVETPKGEANTRQTEKTPEKPLNQADVVDW